MCALLRIRCDSKELTMSSNVKALHSSSLTGSDSCYSNNLRPTRTSLVAGSFGMRQQSMFSEAPLTHKLTIVAVCKDNKQRKEKGSRQAE